jgi:hypothetical protein
MRNPAVEVARRIDGYPASVRSALLQIRARVYAVAKELDLSLNESLKWNEPAYRARDGKGTTVRIDWKPKSPEYVAVYFNCKTTLVESFRAQHPLQFEFEGNRALKWKLAEPIPAALNACIKQALSYGRVG